MQLTEPVIATILYAVFGSIGAYAFYISNERKIVNLLWAIAVLGMIYVFGYMATINSSVHIYDTHHG